MPQRILVAGATGNLGERIVKALIKRGAEVRVLNRKETDPAKTKNLSELGAEVVSVDMLDAEEFKRACQDISCVVSALAGLHDVVVDSQMRLLDAAVAAGVTRFIPSDFSSDFTNCLKVKTEISISEKSSINTLINRRSMRPRSSMVVLQR